MRNGRRLAIDVGKARVGLAISDQSGLLAIPFETVPRRENLAETALAIATAVSDFILLEVYVGLPLSMSGKETASTADALSVAFAVADTVGCEVRLVDERLTTVSATANLRLAGKNSKNSRSIIDQEAAAIILEQALATEKTSGNIPGRSLSDFERPEVQGIE